jgi:hypothetical protein
MGLIALTPGGAPQELRGIIAEETLDINFTAGATLNDLAIGNANIVRFKGSGTVTVNGIASGSVDGRTLKILAGPGATVVIGASQGSSLAVNQFAAALTIAAGAGSLYSWSLATGQWVASGGGAGGATPTISGAPNFVTPPTAGWTFVAQGGSTVTPLYSNSVLSFLVPPQGALGAILYSRPQVSVTFTITACLSVAPGFSCPTGWVGIYHRDNVNGPFQPYIVDLRTAAAKMSCYRFNPLNTFSSTYFAANGLNNVTNFIYQPIWLRQQKVAGGNVTCSISYDGVNFVNITAGTVDATNFVATPNEVGVTFQNDAAAGAQNNLAVNLYSWNVGP